MSDFFQRPPRSPEPDREPPQPPWAGPPRNELGVAIPLRIALARTEAAAVALTSAVGYSTGLEFTLEVRLRRSDENVDPFGMHFRHRRRAEEELPPELLRFGFEFPNGERVTNLGGFPDDRQAGTGRPVLVPRGGGGGGGSWSLGFWLWPLPPQGPLVVAVEWPEQGIALVRHELDTGEIVQAARESEPLWPEDPGPSPVGLTVSQMISSSPSPESLPNDR